jgi:hypothetical protein
MLSIAPGRTLARVALVAALAAAAGACGGSSGEAAPAPAAPPAAPAAPPVAAARSANEPVLVVYKDPNCGCCTKWVEHMRQNGFRVESHDTSGVDGIKNQAGVPQSTRSCHTALIGGYAIEGHVPADLVRRLLRSRGAGDGDRVAGDGGAEPPALRRGRLHQGRPHLRLREALTRIRLKTVWSGKPPGLTRGRRGRRLMFTVGSVDPV